MLGTVWDSVLGSFCHLSVPWTSWAFLGCGSRMEEGQRGGRRAAADRAPVLSPQLPIQRGLQPGPAVHEHPLPRLV